MRYSIYVNGVCAVMCRMSCVTVNMCNCNISCILKCVLNAGYFYSQFVLMYTVLLNVKCIVSEQVCY